MKNLLAAVLIASTPGAHAQAEEPEMAACVDDPLYALLDFWVGNGGGKGQSIFYVDTDGRWQQVWVTAWAANPGGVKEKARVDADGDSVRFQGEVSHPVHGRYLDRTTLTPNGDGTVRQLIEVSTDGGETWRATFDAVYRRE